MHILYAFGGIIVGFIIEIYVFQWVRVFGHIPYMEQKLGPGGTYTFWRLIGVALIIGGFWMFSNPLGV